MARIYPDDFINKIILGDCLEVIKDIPSRSIDAIVTDPPFGIDFKYHKNKDVAKTAEDYWVWFAPIYIEFIRILRAGGFLAIWQPALYFKNFWSWYGDDIHIYAGCKNFVQLRKTEINYGFDPIIMRYKKGNNPLRPNKPKRNLDFFVANTAKFVTETNSLARKHPCPRPIDQATEIVSNFTLDGGIVFDPFVGSGTIPLACKNTGRNFIGIEIDDKYYQLALERINTWRV